MRKFDIQTYYIDLFSNDFVILLYLKLRVVAYIIILYRQ